MAILNKTKTTNSKILESSFLEFDLKKRFSLSELDIQLTKSRKLYFHSWFPNQKMLMLKALLSGIYAFWFKSSTQIRVQVCFNRPLSGLIMVAILR